MHVTTDSLVLSRALCVRCSSHLPVVVLVLMEGNGLNKRLLAYSAVAGAAMGTAYFALSMARRAFFDDNGTPAPQSPQQEPEGAGTAEELQQLVDDAPDGAVVKTTCEVAPASTCVHLELMMQLNGRVVGQWRGTPQKMQSALSRPNTPRIDRAGLPPVFYRLLRLTAGSTDAQPAGLSRAHATCHRDTQMRRNPCWDPSYR